ncbi:MAG: hypothetical protein HY903_16495 [Deltaproteobacteria bacterium]|nr:hypothetical protein [Deltaproteobacteria bacterium]
MPVERIDAQIQSLISSAGIETQKKVDKEDEADHARKLAEKKIAEKKENLKTSGVQREIFQRQSDLQNKMRAVMGGASGPEAQNALNQWQNNAQLQAKLTEAQKDMFREAMAKNPQQATDAGNAMNRLTQQPGFQKAVTNAQQMGTLQQGILQNPKAEKPVAEMLQSRFMQAQKADPQTKNQYLRFGMQQAAKGNLDAMKRAGDMLGVMNKAALQKNAQRAGMNMVARNPADAKAVKNVDAFVQHPEVGKMPTFARSKATEMLCKANGKAEVKEGFEQLAADPKFKSQTAQNKGRFFSTIGTGRPSEYRALADKALVALQNPGFPNRSGQVGKFLSKMATGAQKGGADSVDPEALIKSAKTSELPKAPTLASSEGLDADEAAKVRAQNRAKIIQFYNQLGRIYEQGEKKLNSAKYLEDVNSLQNLREAEAMDTSMLSAEDQAFVNGKQEALKAKLDKVRGLQRQRSRELRTKRMPPAKRRARLEARRLQGKQPKYFNPNSGRVSGTRTFAQKEAVGASRQPLSATPARAQIAASEGAQRAAQGSGNIQAQVANAMAELGPGPLTPERAGQVAAVIANQVATQVAAQVTAQLLGTRAAVGMADPKIAEIPAGEVAVMRKKERTQSGKVDGWGIQRTFDRDLGGTQRAAVKPPSADSEVAAAAPTYDELAAEKYTGRVLVKDPASIRSLDNLFESGWKGLNKSEKALLKNLGWSQQTWDTKDTPAAKWPVSMATPFASLTTTQREAVRKLGFAPHDWDRKIQAFTMGKNA